MKKLKKISKVISTSLALSLVLAACSDKEEVSSNKSGGDKDEKVTIVYARGKDDTQGTTAMVEAFEKKYPNIDVKFKEMPADTGKQHDAYVTAFNANSDEIDVIDLDVIWPAEFAQAGFLMPLDRFMEKTESIQTIITKEQSVLLNLKASNGRCLNLLMQVCFSTALT